MKQGLWLNSYNPFSILFGKLQNFSRSPRKDLLCRKGAPHNNSFIGIYRLHNDGCCISADVWM
jgi:hypothetical protein